MLLVKVHKTFKGRKVVAVCDKELAGKYFEEKKLQLDLSSNFFKGEEKTKKELLEIIKDAHILNFVGKKSVEFALKHEIASADNVKFVKKVPHVMVC